MDNFSTADLLFYMGKWQPSNFKKFQEEKEFAIPAYTLHMMDG